MSKVHASSLETVFKSYLAACFKFAFSLSSRGKSLNLKLQYHCIQCACQDSLW